MQTAEYIDIKGEERIRAILADKCNFLIEAFGFEFLDGWTPDIGLTEYPVRSIFRPPSVIQAGITSHIKHRIKFRNRHFGKRFTGVLLYDDAEGDTELDFTIRDEAMGRIRTRRRDNRRHLLVFKEPREFMSANDVIQISGRGGCCRMEKLVLLTELPEPTVYTPWIENLRLRRFRGEENEATVEASFTSAEPAEHVVTITSGTETSLVKQTQRVKVHRSKPIAYDPEKTYTVEVRAKELDGEECTAQLSLEPEKASGGQQSDVSVPVTIINAGSCESREPPLVFGVPVPSAERLSGGLCSLEIDNRSYPAQARVHARRPDGSAAWMLISTALPLCMGAGEEIPGMLYFRPSARGDSAADAPSVKGLHCTESTNGITVRGKRCTVSLKRGSTGLELFVSGSADTEFHPGLGGSFSTEIELADGSILRGGDPIEWSLLEAGPVSALLAIKIPIQDRTGRSHFLSSSWIRIFNDSPAVSFTHRLEVISPLLSAAGGGDEDSGKSIPDPAGIDIEKVIDGTGNERESLMRVRSAHIELPFIGGKTVETEGKKVDIPAAEKALSTEGPLLRVFQRDDLSYNLEYRETTENRDGHASGCLLVHGGDSACGILQKMFWQTYPNAVSVDAASVLRIELLPELSDKELPGDAEAWHRLYFWKAGRNYRLKAGMAPRKEYTFICGSNTAEVQSYLDSASAEIVVRPGTEYFNSCETWSRICSKNEAPVQTYENWVDQVYEGWLNDRDTARQYGFINFGDWYGESSWSWGNNEYDPPCAQYIEFLRGGRPGWAVLAGQAAKHMADIDTVNYSRQPRQIGGQYMHMPGHAGGYLPSYFRSKMKGSALRSHHMWLEGPVLHYLLTGDEAVKESLEKMGMRLLRGFDITNYDFPNCRFAGWHLTHLCAMARADDNPDYINAARVIVDRILERMTPGGAWDRLLTEPHCPCPPPRHTGGVGFMYGVLLAGLRKYHELTGDERIPDAIIRGAEWLITNTYDEASGGYTYTSCPNPYLRPGKQSGMHVVEGLTYASLLAPANTAIRDRVIELLAYMKEVFADREEHDSSYPGGYGKAVTFDMIFQPIVQELFRLHHLSAESASPK
jgi:hypothetical protein